MSATAHKLPNIADEPKWMQNVKAELQPTKTYALITRTSNRGEEIMAELCWTKVTGIASDGSILEALVNTMELARTIVDIWEGEGVTNVEIS